MYQELQNEAVRLNQRFENVKTNPAWTEQDLQILITAQQDLIGLIDRYHSDLADLFWTKRNGE